MSVFTGVLILLFAPWALLLLVPLVSRLACRILGCDWRVMNLPDGPAARCMRCGRQEHVIVDRTR